MFSHLLPQHYPCYGVFPNPLEQIWGQHRVRRKEESRCSSADPSHRCKNLVEYGPCILKRHALPPTECTAPEFQSATCSSEIYSSCYISILPSPQDGFAILNHLSHPELFVTFYSSLFLQGSQCDKFASFSPIHSSNKPSRQARTGVTSQFCG